MSQAAILDTQRYRLALAGTVVPAAEWRNVADAHALLEQANQALADARVEAGQHRREGFEKGYADGRAAGIDAFAAALGALGEARSALAETMRGQLAELSIAVVEHIAPKIGAQAMLPALVAEAVQHLTQEPALLVRVNPEVADGVRARIAGLEGVALPRTEIIADDELAEFDCVIETPGGLVCAGLDEQLRQARRILASAQGQAGTGEDPDAA